MTDYLSGEYLVGSEAFTEPLQAGLSSRAVLVGAQAVMAACAPYNLGPQLLDLFRDCRDFIAEAPLSSFWDRNELSVRSGQEFDGEMFGGSTHVQFSSEALSVHSTDRIFQYTLGSAWIQSPALAEQALCPNVWNASESGSSFERVRSNLEALQQECKRLLSDLELAGCRLSRQLDQKAIVEQNAQDLEKLKRTLKRLSADCRARFDVWGFSGGAGWEKQARWDALRPMDSLLQDVQVCVAKLREVFYSQRDVLESVGLNESPLIQYLADEALVEDRSWYEFLQQEAPYSDLLAIPRDQLSKKYQTELETANIDVLNLPKWEQQFMKEKDALQGLKEALRELHWLHEQLSRDAFEAEAAKMALSAKWKEIPKKQARCVELKDTAKDLQAESGQLFAALEQIRREKSMVERDAQLAVLIRKHGALKERLYKLSAEAMDREALVHELVRMRQRVDELETKLRVL